MILEVNYNWKIKIKMQIVKKKNMLKFYKQNGFMYNMCNWTLKKYWPYSTSMYFTNWLIFQTVCASDIIIYLNLLKQEIVSLYFPHTL